MNIKHQIKNLMPDGLWSFLSISWRKVYAVFLPPMIVFYDVYVYYRYGGVCRKRSKGALEASIIKSFHSIEKGLSLPHPRPNFGRENAVALLKMANLYIRHYGASDVTRAALNTLEEYAAFNAHAGVFLSDLGEQIKMLGKTQNDAFCHDRGGTIEIEKKNILEKARVNFQEFLNCRYSVRHFSGESVPLDLIKKAVSLAQKTPSVCNRQSGCAFVIENKETMKKALAFQNGNRGFADEIDKLLVITARLETFLSPQERNQPWIDGGMFAMTLVYALHSLGLGTCCLNWDVTPPTDAALKKVCGIPSHHAIIMMIAVGNLPEKFLVAESPRRTFKEVYFPLS